MELDMDPNFVAAHRGLAFAYKDKGSEKEWISEWEQHAALAGAPDLAEAIRVAYAHGGYKRALRAQLNYNQRRRSAGSSVRYLDFAWAYAALGENDLALQALEKAFADREPMAWLDVDPQWDSIRADRRFQDLVRRTGLPLNAAAGSPPH